MQSMSLSDRLVLAAVLILVALITGFLIGGGIRGLIFYGRWLKQQTLSRRIQLGLLHLSPFLSVGLSGLSVELQAPDILCTLLGVFSVLSVIGNWLVIFISSCIHGFYLVQKVADNFGAFRSWQKILLITVPLDLLWSWVSRG